MTIAQSSSTFLVKLFLKLDRENVETAVHDSTLEELPFEAIEDYLVRNSARISSETIRLLNIQNNCDKEGETDRAFDLTDVANINQASLPTDF